MRTRLLPGDLGSPHRPSTEVLRDHHQHEGDVEHNQDKSPIVLGPVRFPDGPPAWAMGLIAGSFHDEHPTTHGCLCRRRRDPGGVTSDALKPFSRRPARQVRLPISHTTRSGKHGFAAPVMMPASIASLFLETEYDIQDLLHSQLRSWVADIRPEEFTPSYAGSATRMDFLLPAHSLVIEVKRIRDKAHAARVGDELVVDMEHYRWHPDCTRLWCAIYDPRMLIKNPAGMVSGGTVGGARPARSPVRLRRGRHFPTHQGGRSQVGLALRRMPASPAVSCWTWCARRLSGGGRSARH